MNVLVIDVGGTHVKVLATGQKEHREFVSGPKLTAAMMAAGVRKLANGWNYGAVSIGYPGPVCHNRPIAEPYNLGMEAIIMPSSAGFVCGRKLARANFPVTQGLILTSAK